MNRYRKKPVVIEAVQWTGENEREMYKFLTGSDEDPTDEENTFVIDFCNGGCRMGDLYIKTLKGKMKADKGDWIIKGVIGEFYPCDLEVFEMTYEKEEKV